MNISKKFQNKLRCVCNNYVLFEIIDEVEFNWGIHTIIQCPDCQDLFSVDKKCPSFQNIFELIKNNPELYSKQEKSDYVLNSHPC